MPDRSKNNDLNLSTEAKGTIQLNYMALRKASLILRAVNHQARKQIITMLEQKGRMTVTDIYVRLRTEQSVASQHLAILKKTGLVQSMREGKFIYYTLNAQRAEEINVFIENLVGPLQ